MTSNPDWFAIRTDYENGLSLRALAAKHHVPKSVIGRQKHKEQWDDQSHQRDTGTLSNNQEVINRDVNAGVRASKAIGFRQAGMTYERIAAQCGYASPGAARNAVQRELERVIVQDIEEWRSDHIARLEKLHEEAWSMAMDKENRGRLFAYDRLLAIAEREAKLLGLDTKLEDMLSPQVVIEEVPAGYLEGPRE